MQQAQSGSTKHFQSNGVQNYAISKKKICVPRILNVNL